MLIRPAVGKIASNEFEAREQTLAAGEAAAQAALPEIKRRLALLIAAKQRVAP